MLVKINNTDNKYYLHEVALTKKEDNMPFKTGSVRKGTPSGKLSSIYSLIQSLQNVNENIDTDGNTLNEAQQEYFKDSKVRDENGWEYRTVYIQDAKTQDIFSAELNIANTKDGCRILYDISNIKKVDDGIVASAPSNDGVGSPGTSTFIDNIPQNFDKSSGNTKYSLSLDSEGNKITTDNPDRRYLLSSIAYFLS